VHQNKISVIAAIFIPATDAIAATKNWIRMSLCFRTVSVVLLAILPIGCNHTTTTPPGVVSISNVEPRRDVRGGIVDAHDGCLQFFNGRYYLYGTAYGNSAEYDSTSNRYRVYSSPDLARWTYEGELFKAPPEGVYYRPYVIYNAATHKYVLWYNWYAKLWNGQTGVAISDTPVGPFTIVNPKVRLHSSSPGDGSLFEDDDGAAYFIYTALEEAKTIRIERLTPDYLAATGDASGILAVGVESPVLFRRHNRYYALCGPACYAWHEGSEVQVMIASAPLGPYRAKSEGDINRQPRDQPLHNVDRETWAISVCSSNVADTASQPNGDKRGVPMIIHDINAPLIPAQETWVAKIPTDGEPLFVWMADRWDSTPDGIKGHNFQYWSPPLEFSTDGDILPLEFAAKWQLPPARGK
jgi:hypothetical protein